MGNVLSAHCIKAKQGDGEWEEMVSNGATRIMPGNKINIQANKQQTMVVIVAANGDGSKINEFKGKMERNKMPMQRIMLSFVRINT